jgi:hypothetical protein
LQSNLCCLRANVKKKMRRSVTASRVDAERRQEAAGDLLVPTLRVGTPPGSLCDHPTTRDLQRGAQGRPSRRGATERGTLSGSDTIRVYPLDSLGRASRFRTHVKNPEGTVDLAIDPAIDRTPWYGIERVAKTSTGIGDAQVPSAMVLQVYPNPVSTAVTVRVTLPRTVSVRMTLHDALGRLITSEQRAQASAGLFETRVQMRGLADGVYQVSIAADGTTLRRQVIVRHR